MVDARKDNNSPLLKLFRSFKTRGGQGASGKDGQASPVPVLALFLAWIVPGAGHLYLGRAWRGLIIFLGISATFWAGVAMGGVMTVDYENERWWFMSEMLTGVHGIVSWQRQSAVYDELKEDPDIRQAAREGHLAATIDKKLAEDNLALVYPTETVARAYAGVAGLLNLMCIFDAVMLSLMGVTGERAPTGSTRGKRKEGDT